MPTPKTTYAVKRQFPSPTPTVVVVFRGLLTFCFSGNLNCEVGINNQAPVSQRHLLNMKVWKKEPRCPVAPIIESGDPPRTREIEIDVHNPTELDGVYVYQRDPFDRMSVASDSRDYRWVLDFEGPDLYNQRLPKLSPHVRPSLNVNNGLFYTRQVSQSKFALRSRTSDRPIGPVAKIVAANIYLGPSGYVDLNIDGVRLIRMDQLTDVTYQVDFTNDCSPPAGHCGYDPGNATKETRNDFYLNHRVFTRPGGLEELELICSDVQPSVPDPDLCGQISSETTDPAPCMGSGFGQSPSHD